MSPPVATIIDPHVLLFGLFVGWAGLLWDCWSLLPLYGVFGKEGNSKGEDRPLSINAIFDLYSMLYRVSIATCSILSCRLFRAALWTRADCCCRVAMPLMDIEKYFHSIEVILLCSVKQLHQFVDICRPHDLCRDLVEQDMDYLANCFWRIRSITFLLKRICLEGRFKVDLVL